MADTNKTSTTGSARLTPTEHLIQVKDENAQLKTELATARERLAAAEKPAPEVRRPEVVSTPVTPPVTPVAKPANQKGWIWTLGMILVACIAAGIVFFSIFFLAEKCDLVGWWDYMFARNIVAADTAPPADPKPAASATCDDSCKKSIIRVRCGAFREVFTDRDDVTAEQFGTIVDKACPVAAPIVAPADPIVEKICLCEPKQEQPKAKPRIQRDKPKAKKIYRQTVETACYLRVRVEGGRTLGVHIGIDGIDRSHFDGDRSDQVSGTEIIPVPCSMVYAQSNLEVCFEGTGESELMRAGVELPQYRARYEAAKAAGKSQVVLNVSTIYWYPS